MATIRNRIKHLVYRIDRRDVLLRNHSIERLLNAYGVLRSSVALSADAKRTASLYFDFRERAYVALSVAQFFPGGDYFEFGSEGMGTFRNFLTAFDLSGCDSRYPATEFYAFDIFGDMTGATEDLEYFRSWHDGESDRYARARTFVTQHGLFVDRCHLVRGFFESTLTPDFKSRYRSSNRSIGFAFLDCNITRSYRTVFNFLDGILTDRAFIYMDEYLCNPEVPVLFREFCERAGKTAVFIRNAGAFGSLYQLQA